MITPITATFPALNFPKEGDYPTQEDWAAFSAAAELNYGILSGTWSDKSEEFKEQTNNLALEIQAIGENVINAISLDTVDDLATYTGTGLVMVKDINRGGTFVSKTAIEIDPKTGSLYTVNGGTVFAKSGGGFWVRQYNGAVLSSWFIDITGNITTQIQYLFDTFDNIKLTDSYYVDYVTISGIGKIIDFNGNHLIGTRAFNEASSQYVLGIAGRELKLYNISVNADFKNYASAIRWYSTSAGSPAQYNKIFGLHTASCDIGILFGQEIGTASVDAAQSENAVYSYTCRGVRNPFVGNQSNGFIEFFGSIFDSNPYEWSLQPAFDMSAYATNSLCINNIVGSLKIHGGEILKTYSQLGYGVKGNVEIYDSVVEVACANYLVQDSMFLENIANGFMASDSAAVVTFETNTGEFTANNVHFLRGSGASSYSGASFATYLTTDENITIKLANCFIDEWKLERLPSLVDIRDSNFVTDNKIIDTYTNTNLLKDNGVNTFINKVTGWNFTAFYGGETHGIIIDSPYTGGTSLHIETLGGAMYSTIDKTSLATIIDTALPINAGSIIEVSLYKKLVSGGGNNPSNIVLYDNAGNLIRTFSLGTIASGNWVNKKVRFTVNDTEMYMGIVVSAELSKVAFTDIKVKEISI